MAGVQLRVILVRGMAALRGGMAQRGGMTVQLRVIWGRRAST